MDGWWSTQDAKQRLSELLRAAHEDGPQIVTKHGAEVAVVLDVVEYRRLARPDAEVDLKQALAGAPLFDVAAGVLADVVTERRRDQPRDLDFGGAR